MKQRITQLANPQCVARQILTQCLAISLLTSPAWAFAENKDSELAKKSTQSTSPLAIDITGTVTDESGSGLPGVNVVVKGSTQGTTTDADGKFKIAVPDNRAVLVFSSVGYQRQEIAVGNQTTLTIKLLPDDQTLSEVVVVGYGSQLKKEVTGAVQTVTAKELKDIPVSQVTQKLQGRLAGVQINQATGKPGQGMSVRIRGQLSVSAGSEPLYVVDGFPITGNIGALNPDEIEDISILKDASSTSLYGSRAANGVVLITTKRGQAGKTSVSFNTYVGMQQVPEKGRIKMLNAQEFAQFKKEFYEDQGQAVPPEFQNPSQYSDNDWYGALLRKAPIQSYNLTISSNTERARTSIVAGVFDQEGVILNTKYTRYSLRMNTDYDVSDKIRVGFNIAPSTFLIIHPVRTVTAERVFCSTRCTPGPLCPFATQTAN